MGCMHTKEVERPNMFQRNLCVHHNRPANEVYTVLNELGKGAFGIVEKVEHKRTKRQYAMKTLTFTKAQKRSEFEREMDLLRGLHHPNIVNMVETYEDDRHFYIIMELCTIGTLLDKIKERGHAFSEDFVKDVVMKLASVIQYLHCRQICHRDLKLENVLMGVDEEGSTIQLCDFGASTLFRMGVPMRRVLGSIVYMAPEVIEGNYRQSCDLWSLGVIMYMLLSNKPPFYGPTEENLIDSIFEGIYTFEGPEWHIVSPEAKKLISRLLMVDPTQRYTASQVLEDPWIKSRYVPVPQSVYDTFIPRIKAFCHYSPLLRSALAAVAFCTPPDHLVEHSKVYNELNVAHNGNMSLEELKQSTSLAKYNLDLDQVYLALDQKHEHGINFLEFVSATLPPEDVADENILRMAFEIFDRKATGVINHEDLMELLGQHFGAAACHQMISRADMDKDGHVGFDDFKQMMKTHSRSMQFQHAVEPILVSSPKKQRYRRSSSPSVEMKKEEPKHRRSTFLADNALKIESEGDDNDASDSPVKFVRMESDYTNLTSSMEAQKSPKEVRRVHSFPKEILEAEPSKATKTEDVQCEIKSDGHLTASTSLEQVTTEGESQAQQ